MWRRLAGIIIALGLALPSGAHTVCSAATQSQAACSATPLSITHDSAGCLCVEAAPSGPFGGHATLTDDLVAYWPLDEESGTRVDIVGGADLTDNNTVGFTAVVGPPNFPAGKAATFVAANTESLSRASQVFDQNGSWTISVWLYRSSELAFQGVFHSDPGFRSYFHNSSDRFDVELVGVGILARTIPSAGEWFHLVLWHDNGDDSVGAVVNGGSAITGTSNINSVQANWIIGSNSAGAANMLSAHVAVWTRALTVAERTALYNSGAGLFYED